MTEASRNAVHFVLFALSSVAGCATPIVQRSTLPPVRVQQEPRGNEQVAVTTTTALPTPDAPPLTGLAALPGWNNDHTAEVLPAWRRTCARLLSASDSHPIGHDAILGTAASWKPACEALPPDNADDDTVRAYFQEWFVSARVDPEGKERGLFTGYYEAELHGSRTRSDRFKVPLYGRPTDLVSARPGEHGTGRMVRGHVRPYWTRAEIAAGSMGRNATPLLWVDNAVDAFFLEIEGSGHVVLDDGSTVWLNYSASNGHAYVPIGRVLIERGELTRETVSMQSIRAWLAAHPNEAQTVMNANPSYVFFHESQTQGSHGSAGVVLTPGRSMAVDPRFIPLGVPLFLDLSPLEGVGSIQRLVIAQDTGGAIRGAVRGDLFWGSGPDAYEHAGRMQQSGRYWMLVPKTITPPVITANPTP